MPDLPRRSALSALSAVAVLAAGAGAAAFAAGESSAGGDAAGNGWRIGSGGTLPVDDRSAQIKGYASAASVPVGGVLDFHVSTRPARRYRITVHRVDGGGADGGARLLAASPELRGTEHPVPEPHPRTGLIRCDWPVGWRLEVPRGWPSGSYLAAFTAESGHRSYAPFVVRDDGRRAGLLVVLPFATYQAYNQWPLDGRTGRSLYYGYGHDPSGGAAEASGTPVDAAGAAMAYGLRARQVSFDRPYSGIGLPQRADMDFHAVRWLEREGFGADAVYAAGTDLHDGTADLSRYRAVVFTGHDEYWSAPMREAVAAAVDGGTSVAFLGANNVYWHVRFPGAGARTVECWKTDPDPAPGPGGPTRRWRDLGRHSEEAEQRLLGVQYNGIPRTEVPLVVARSRHWFWAGTGVADGHAVPRIVGGEADGLDEAAPRPAAAVEQVLLSASPYRPHGRAEATLTQHTSLYRTGRGALFFVAGTFNWPAGLDRPGYADPRIQRATRNLLRRMTASGRGSD